MLLKKLNYTLCFALSYNDFDSANGVTPQSVVAGDSLVIQPGVNSVLGKQSLDEMSFAHIFVRCDRHDPVAAFQIKLRLEFAMLSSFRD